MLGTKEILIYHLIYVKYSVSVWLPSREIKTEKMKSKVKVTQLCPSVCDQAPLSMEFSKRECWLALPYPSPGDLSDPEIEPRSPALQADSLPSEPTGKPPLSARALLSLPIYNWTATDLHSRSSATYILIYSLRHETSGNSFKLSCN